jgi:hypothetical protein
MCNSEFRTWLICCPKDLWERLGLTTDEEKALEISRRCNVTEEVAMTLI